MKGYSRKGKVHIRILQLAIAEEVSSPKLHKGRFGKVNEERYVAESLLRKGRCKKEIVEGRD